MRAPGSGSRAHPLPADQLPRLSPPPPIDLSRCCLAVGRREEQKQGEGGAVSVMEPATSSEALWNTENQEMWQHLANTSSSWPLVTKQ